MRTSLYIVVAMVLGLTTAFAAGQGTKRASHYKAPESSHGAWSRPYGMAGCGLGSLVIDKKGPQIFAATTNGTFYSQTFGITSGTSNCVDGPNQEVAQRIDHFIQVNQAQLANDMARGNGETLNSLATIMDCTDIGAVSSAMQRNFKTIFPSEGVQPNEVTDSVITVIRNDNELARSCKRVS